MSEIKKKKPVDLYFDSIPERWDNVEISAIYQDEQGNCEPIFNDTPPSFYSVYLHEESGGVQCIADCIHKEDAEMIFNTIKQVVSYTFLRKVINNYVDNGYIEPNNEK